MSYEENKPRALCVTSRARVSGSRDGLSAWLQLELAARAVASTEEVDEGGAGRKLQQVSVGTSQTVMGIYGVSLVSTCSGSTQLHLNNQITFSRLELDNEMK